MTTEVSSTSQRPSNVDTSIVDNDDDRHDDDKDCSDASTAAFLQSPVPLSSEEAASEEVQRLALALAPALVAADDELQHVATDFQRNVKENSAEEDDMDDIDDEMEHLRASEALLRQEMELANDFSHLFSFSQDGDEEDDYYDDKRIISGVDPEGSFAAVTVDSSKHESSTSEADVDDDEHDDSLMEEIDKKLQPIPLTPPSGKKKRPSEPTTPEQDNNNDSLFALPSTSKRLHGVEPIHYTATEHSQKLKVHREEHGGWYSVSLSSEYLEGANDDNVKEYCVAVPDVKLKQMFVGFSDNPRQSKVTTNSPDAKSNSRQYKSELPVRTVAMRIRPDVLCGSVMEAVHHSVMESNAHVLRRQGGHVRAVVPSAIYQSQDFAVAAHVSDDQQYRPIINYPPFLLDARLVTYKSDDCERMLVVRIFHNNENEVFMEDEQDQNDGLASNDNVLGASPKNHNVLDDPIEDKAAIHLRESAALIQRIEASSSTRRIAVPVGSPAGDLTQTNIQNIVSTHLLEHYRACPSVQDGGITLPALNAQDFSVIQSSWRFIQSLWEEIDTRDLAYSTLKTCRFGAFPNLPTLDVHYCSQIRRLARESMTLQVVKSARDLEEYAREAELACANMIALLRPAYEAYEVEAPSLPRPRQITDYQLNYVVPQEACPPWGDKVQHALNEIQAWTGDANKDNPSPFAAERSELSSIESELSFEMTRSAVRSVLEAFHKQDDEEQSARLDRKNVQVMDRLAKMQLHQKLSIQTLENSAAFSPKARKAAEDFKNKAGHREVPLVKWSVVVGKATGTCTITAKHILFVTKLIPVLGGIRKNIYALEHVEFSVQDNSTSLLNPLPTVVRISQHGDEVFSFRPSMGGSRLKSFLDVVKTAAFQEPLVLPPPERRPAPHAESAGD